MNCRTQSNEGRKCDGNTRAHEKENLKKWKTLKL